MAYFSLDNQFPVAIMLVGDIVHLMKESSQFWNEKSFSLFFQEVQQLAMLLSTAVYLFFKSSSSLCHNFFYFLLLAPNTWLLIIVYQASSD